MRHPRGLTALHQKIREAATQNPTFTRGQLSALLSVHPNTVYAALAGQKTQPPRAKRHRTSGTLKVRALLHKKCGYVGHQAVLPSPALRAAGLIDAKSLQFRVVGNTIILSAL